MVQIVQNQSFKDHHILQKWKVTKTSPFKTITFSQGLTVENESSWPLHFLQVKLSTIVPFQKAISSKSEIIPNHVKSPTSSQSQNY